MAISDAYVMATCDHNGCRSEVEMDLPFTYGGIMHTEGHYDHDEERIKRRLAKDHEWVFIDDQHFCCPECAESEAGDG